MVTQDCPWCEAEMSVDPSEIEPREMVCVECSTSWLTIDATANELADELALAA